MTKRNRSVALFMALAVFVVVLFSSLYTVENADHDCVGESCPICAQIAVCENTLHGFSMAAVAVAAIVFAPVFCALAVKPAFVSLFSDTLVSLKVKLSD